MKMSTLRHDGQEIRSIRAHEMEVRKPRAFPLSVGATYALGHDVDADARLFRVSR
jgi:hypothetical protein